MAAYDAQTKLFKAVGHPARLAILDVLRDGEACVCHMEAALGYRQAYISQHLMVLRDAGLVQDRRDGWNIFYSVTNPGVFDVLSAAQSATGSHAAPRAHPRKIENCPCPHCNPVAEAAAC